MVERGVAGAAERDQLRDRVSPGRPVMDHDAGRRLADAARTGIAREDPVAATAEADLGTPLGEVAGAAEPRDGRASAAAAKQRELKEHLHSIAR